MITDQELIKAAYSLEGAARAYSATYLSGQQITLGADNLKHARALANEYGVRFLGGVRVSNVQWLRP
jgi:hypothetical protein